MLTIIKAEISIKIATIQATIHIVFFLYGISYKKAWLAKYKILERLFGSHKESFQMLPRMLLALKELNPSTVIEWDHKMVDDDISNIKKINMGIWTFNSRVLILSSTNKC